MNDKTKTPDAAAGTAAANGEQGASATQTPAPPTDTLPDAGAQTPPKTESEGAAPTAAKQPAGSAAGKTTSAPTPPWQLPNYAGPLTIEHAQWRNANIKQQTARTK
jgi:hypothetical protein